MFRTLYAKLALAQAVVFIALGAVFIAMTEQMLEGRRLLELATDLVVGAVVCALLAALLASHLLTRRLRALERAVEVFRDTGFTQPIKLVDGNPDGDDIDRLGAAVQEMSQRIARQLEVLGGIDAKRRELLANVSHDLRTPLASMQGYLETLLLQRGTLPPEEERSYLEIAVRHSERLGKLIRDLFQLTKLEAHEVVPQLEAINLAELAQDVVQKYQIPAERRGLRIAAWQQGEQQALQADIGMIESVLENLLENALRHTPAGGTIRVETEPVGQELVVRVSDTGRGIQADELPYVFDRYYRVNRGEISDAGSTGLGLAIARHVVELHGGRIEVASEPGRGTTFTLRFPAAPGAAEPR